MNNPRGGGGGNKIGDYIDSNQVERIAAQMMKNQYGHYLMTVLEDTIPDGTAE